jgi:hypothetical protein
VGICYPGVTRGSASSGRAGAMGDTAGHPLVFGRFLNVA